MAKSPKTAKAKTKAVEDDVVVFRVLAARMGKGARRIRGKIVFDPERSRHAKVHQEPITRGKLCI